MRNKSVEETLLAELKKELTPYRIAAAELDALLRRALGSVKFGFDSSVTPTWVVKDAYGRLLRGGDTPAFVCAVAEALDTYRSLPLPWDKKKWMAAVSHAHKIRSTTSYPRQLYGQHPPVWAITVHMLFDVFCDENPGAGFAEFMQFLQDTGGLDKNQLKFEALSR